MSTYDDLEIDILLVEAPSYYADRKQPMIGCALRVPWWNLRTWLSHPMIATDKAEHGAWTPALFRDNRKKKENLIRASSLLVDVDAGGNVARVADLLIGHLAIVHSTFSSTPEAPRCRIVLPFKEPVDACTYETTFRAVTKHLHAAGIVVDEGTKDAGRLGFLPCVCAGSPYAFRAVEGEPLDAKAIVAAQPCEPVRSATRGVLPEHRDRYVGAALEKAADEIANASEGSRHYMLSREAFRLARPELDLTEAEIAAALLPAFVVSAGERRADEGARTIRDAVHARTRVA